MGNSCCIGRLHPNPKPAESTAVQPELKPKPPKSKKKPSSKQEGPTGSSQINPKKSAWKEILEAKQPTIMPKKKADDGSLAYSSSESISDPESKEANNAINMFSRRSELTDRLDYDLILPENCTKAQQDQIIAALDKYKLQLPEGDDDELVDGLGEVFDDNEKKVVMVTTHAVYLVSLNDYSDVQKRVKIDYINLVVFNKKRDEVVLQVSEQELENLHFQAEKAKDIVKSIEQVAFEAYEKYIPWVVADSNGILEYVKKKNMTYPNIIQKISDAVYKAIIENGEVGESILLHEKCSVSLEKPETKMSLILTDKAVYILNENHEFNKIAMLSKLEKIVLNKKANFFVLYEEGGVLVIAGVSKIYEKIKQEARNAGNPVSVLEE